MKKHLQITTRNLDKAV